MEHKAPGLLVLWLTNDCNLGCRYCYADAGRKKESMTLDTAIRAVGRMGQEGFKLQLAGGEPLMNMVLVRKLYEYITEKGIRASLRLQTNGTLITPEIAGEIRRMRIAVGVSLDGGIDANEALRGGTAEVLKGIRHLAAEGVGVNLNCVLTGQNIESLPGLVDLAFYLGNVKGVGIDLLRRAGRAVKNEVPPARADQIGQALREAYTRTLELERASGRRIYIREIEEAKKRLKAGKGCREYCYAACGRAMVVLPGGNVWPCGSLVGIEGYFMGNVMEGEVAPLALKGGRDSACGGCRYETLCPGGCPSRLILNCGAATRQSQDCALRKTAFEIAEEEINACI